MSCCNNLTPVQIGATFSRSNTNPCCMINARPAIFNSFSGQLRGYTNMRGADFNRAIAQIRKF